MRVAVIPARGGSKRIPNKNIRKFAGKPIISWSIEAALDSGCFDKVVVSTDSAEIAETARAYGAEVPFVRPSEFADDLTPTIPVIRHAIQELRRQGLSPEEVCCIYATAPFLTPENLCTAFEMLPETEAFVLAVTEYRFPIQRALRRDADGRIAMFSPEYFATRSQDLESAWHDAGQFYLARAVTWLSESVVFQEGSIGVALPTSQVQDIDTPDDWLQAELMYEALQSRISRQET
ncbi:pseudaminic acid cytidylyltransferase [Pseudophaeobacter arcticus]|uniref:pseudaminic acid cytidylyltransferase n=1 Tax=Pseudophaeobacter arcticus TaxID=385492 RepID=UPI0004134405|nr:pseudaminic acid cytidylyltransferase [Pseudophaeobacter arcticus]